MSASTSRVVFKRGVALAHLGSRWAITNDAGSTIWLDCLNVAVAEAASRMWRTIDGVGSGAECDSSDDVRSVQEDLVALQLAENPTQKMTNRLHGLAVDFYLRRRRHANWLDYSKADALEIDRSLMDEYRLDEAEVAIDGSSTARGVVPDRLANETRLYEVFLRWTFGRRGEALFHDAPVALKYIPSFGARHGLHSQLWLRGHRSRLDQFFLYDETADRLVESDGLSNVLSDWTPEETARIFISADLDRYMWRYRDSMFLTYVYLDLGHAVANCFYVAERLGLRLSHKQMSDVSAANVMQSPILAEISCHSASANATMGNAL